MSKEHNLKFLHVIQSNLLIVQYLKMIHWQPYSSSMNYSGCYMPKCPIGQTNQRLQNHSLEIVIVVVNMFLSLT